MFFYPFPFFALLYPFVESREDFDAFKWEVKGW